MIYFTLRKFSSVSRDKLYAISVDVKNFSNIMPKYFESISIAKSIESQIIADEKIRFLGSSLSVKTKHVILPPDVHEVYIMSDMLHGSSFIEKYEEIPNGTNVTIEVSIKFNGISKLFLPFGFFIKRKMSNVMDEFLKSSKRINSDYSNAQN